MGRGPHKEKCPEVDAQEALAGPVAATRRPSEAQRRYLERGLTQAGGKLPLFDHNGREVSRKTIESCVAQGWATAWIPNPIKPDWLVCRLTERTAIATDCNRRGSAAGLSVNHASAAPR